MAIATRREITLAAQVLRSSNAQAFLGLAFAG